MFCENCGAEYFGKQVFCEKCGHKLPDTDSSLDDNKDEQKALEPAIEPVSVDNTQQSEPSPVENSQTSEPIPVDNTQQTEPSPLENNLEPEVSPVVNNQPVEPVPAVNNQQSEPSPVVNNQQAQPSPAVNNMQPQKNNGKRKKGIFGVIKFLFLEIIILGAMIYFLVPYIFGNFSAEHKAKQYFVALVNEDYDSVYSLFNINTEDDKNFLLKKDGIKQYRASAGLTDVLNYKVNDNSPFWKMDKDDEIRKEVVISYTNRGDSKEHTFTVNLVKESAKKYYIFDDWSIDYVGIAASNVKINVAEGAKVKVDDVEIPEKYLTTGEVPGDSTYTIPIIFTGNHKIEVSKDGLETLKRNETVTGNNDNISLDDMRLSKDTAEALEELAINNMKSVYLAALNGDSFDKIKDIFVQDTDSLNLVKAEYDELAQGLNNDSRHVTKIDFTSVNTEIDVTEPVVTKTVFYQIYFSYYYRPWFGDPEWKDSNNTGSMYIRTEFKYVDGKWLQTDLGCKKPSIYAF